MSKPWYEEFPKPREYYSKIYPKFREEDVQVKRTFAEPYKGHIGKSRAEIASEIFEFFILVIGAILFVMGVCFTRLLNFACRMLDCDWQAKPVKEENKMYFVGFGVAGIVMGFLIFGIITRILHSMSELI